MCEIYIVYMNIYNDHVTGLLWSTRQANKLHLFCIKLKDL